LNSKCRIYDIKVHTRLIIRAADTEKKRRDLIAVK